MINVKHSIKPHVPQTHMFYVCCLKPAQDPGQLVHSGESGAFDPHGLKHNRREERKRGKTVDKFLTLVNTLLHFVKTV